MHTKIGLWLGSWLLALTALCPCTQAEDAAPANIRRPESDQELRRWLENMVWHHRYTDEEVRLATGMELTEIEAARKRFGIDSGSRPARKSDEALRVLPYPGGRHPRIGFLDGAIHPQRETKVSIFTPWDPHSYVVLDAPEAIFSNLGLIYLAHTHVPTIWDKQRIQLPTLEWNLEENGALAMERTLPNEISFGTRVVPRADHVDIDFWIDNGTNEPLSDMRMQMCVMLRGAPEFASQTNDNKLFWKNYAVCHNEKKSRWVIVAFAPPGRTWANPPCPCLHSDPVLRQCEPGKTVHSHGWLSFYEGRDIDAELKRIDARDWQNLR